MTRQQLNDERITVNLNFRSRLINGELLIGTLVSLPSPEIAEILAEVGFDWLFLDTEHGVYSTVEAQAILQAVGGRCAGIVRVPSGDDVWLKKALDIGADGVIVPLVKTAAEAAAIASACKYPPEGTRGVGLSRAHKYGKGFEEYMKMANEEIAVILQVENRDAVDNIESIVAVDGIDAIFIGPYDLSASLGKTGQVDDPEVVAAIKHVCDICISQNVRLGYFGATAQAAQPYIDQGFTLITAGTDALLMTKSAADALKTLKK